ncbi:MAG: class I SAM-dependent methyltransferase [Actinomycetota bacterium]|nr:class I SAM-dependent methyltransferase [Actinomycetota bacterium]
MPASAAHEEVKRANARYHDLAAATYDVKWGIVYDAVAQRQTVGKLRRALGGSLPRFGRALEIGAGTGYFTLNLLRAGVIGEAVATDISPGMLDELESSATELGLEVETVTAQASELPFPDGAFDLVFGHAVLHHLPDLDAAFAELARVLRPGGALAFCGEPSHHGDRLAAIPKRAAMLAAPAWRLALRAPPRRTGAVDGPGVDSCDQDRLERIVDVHAFRPGELARHARQAGLQDVLVTGEELAASWFGWANRTLESTAAPDELPWLWYQWACRGYLTLQRLDRAVLEPRLPATVFYNLLLSARRAK